MSNTPPSSYARSSAFCALRPPALLCRLYGKRNAKLLRRLISGLTSICCLRRLERRRRRMKKNKAAAIMATASVTPIAIAATAPRGKPDPFAAPTDVALYGISGVINAE